MKRSSPNFLTCPAVSELPPPESIQEPHVSVAEPPTSRLKLPRRARRGWKLAFTCIIILLLVSMLPGALALFRASIAAHAAWIAIGRARTHAAAFEFAGMKTEIAHAHASVVNVRTAIHAIGVWRDVPGIGTQLRAIEDMAAVAAQALDGVGDIADAAADVLAEIDVSRRFHDLSTEEKRAVVRGIARALPKLRIARDKVDLAFELWSAMPRDRQIRPIRLAMQPLADTLPVLKRALDQAVPLIEIGAPLAGVPEPLRALVLLQNADELRPAGGFIGTIGTVTLDAGNLTEFDFTDVYHIDRPVETMWNEVPPKPIAEQLGVRAWFLRDANWSPDFPSSAERVLDYYARERSLAAKVKLQNVPSAVVALEPGFFSALLALTGPITVDGTMFTAENFFERLEYEVEIGFAKKGIPTQKRKELVAQVGAALLEHVKALPLSRWPEVLHLVTSALNRKQILLYAQQPELRALLDARGWTGRAKSTMGDFLWVVDANLAALKTDGVMEKRAAYTLDARDPTNPIATLVLTYTNTNRVIDWRHTRYRSYTRVYVPEGSALLEASGSVQEKDGSVDVMRELGKTVFGTFWSIEPGQTKMLRMKYRIPPSFFESIAHGVYRLDWSKQPGADKTKLTLELLFGKKLLSAMPGEDPEKWGDAKYEYKTDSLEDRKFELTF